VVPLAVREEEAVLGETMEEEAKGIPALHAVS